MATTAAIVGATAAAGGAAMEYKAGQDAKKEAEKQARIQRQADLEAEKRSLLGAAQSASSNIKAESIEKQKEARNTAKVYERKRRKGNGSLLTGSEAGLNAGTSTGLGASPILV